MMATVKLFASLRNGRFDMQKIQLDEGISTGELIELLNIPAEEVSIIFINGRHAAPEDKIEEDDTIALFPPIGGG